MGGKAPGCRLGSQHPVRGIYCCTFIQNSVGIAEEVGVCLQGFEETRRTGWGQHTPLREYRVVETHSAAQPLAPFLSELGQGLPQFPYVFYPEHLTGLLKGPEWETDEGTFSCVTWTGTIVLPGGRALPVRSSCFFPTFHPLLKSQEAAKRMDSLDSWRRILTRGWTL